MESREPVETVGGKLKMVSSTAFDIPELPRGKLLQMNVLSTWGDPHYLGLQVSRLRVMPSVERYRRWERKGSGCANSAAFAGNRSV